MPARPRLVVVRGNDRGREFELKRRETQVGRSRTNHIVLTDTTVSRHHVTFILDDRGVRARDEGSGNGTLKNGSTIGREARVWDGDEIEIGSTVVRVEGAGAASEEDVRGGDDASDDRPMSSPLVVPRVATRAPQRDLKPFVIAGGGLVAVALLALVVVALLSGPANEAPVAEEHAPQPAVAAAPAPAAAATPLVVTTLPPAVPVEPPSIKPAPRKRPSSSARDRDRDRERDDRVRVVRDKEPAAEDDEPAPRASGSERLAASLYQEKQFAEASRALRDLAEREPRLAATAKDYAIVGAGLARGDANAETNPGVALAAYQDALAADVRSGDGAHGEHIRGRLAKVAPAAAAAFVDAGRFEQARAACDIAVNYGTGGDRRVRTARDQLEDAAADLYRRAQVLRDTDADEAKLLFRRILKIVPSESEWSSKAVAALRD